MGRTDCLAVAFVEFIPEVIEDGRLYVSIEHATAVHNCACGCGTEVATPLNPTDWAVTYDGETASLDPSIGNWDFSCRSHYWVRRGRVQWAGSWSRERIEAGRAADRDAKRQQYGETSTPPALPQAVADDVGFWGSVWDRLRSLWSA